MDFSDFLRTEGRELKCKAGDHIFRQGDVDRSLYWVKAGMMKAYYLDEEGKEHVKSLLMSGDFIGSLSSAYKGEACSFSLLCLEGATLMQVPFDGLYAKALTDQTVAKTVMEFLLAFAMKKERREYELLCLSAEDRYRLLLENMPQFSHSVTQETIARYLGVTPVALSRIKKRVTVTAKQAQ